MLTGDLNIADVEWIVQYKIVDPVAYLFKVRDAGETFSVVERQLRVGLKDVTADRTRAIVIAYEPVWAIGTGRTPTEEEIEIAHDHIRTSLIQRIGPSADQIRLLYGGSMKPDNAAAILAIDNVDGGLIGGASLKADDFCAIAAAADA